MLNKHVSGSHYYTHSVCCEVYSHCKDQVNEESVAGYWFNKNILCSCHYFMLTCLFVTPLSCLFSKYEATVSSQLGQLNRKTRKSLKQLLDSTKLRVLTLNCLCSNCLWLAASSEQAYLYHAALGVSLIFFLCNIWRDHELNIILFLYLT